jgi:Dyp-type peroxidase family
MRRDLTIKTGSMAGTSDFRVLAPIKKGFVPSLDATTYKTRVKYVLRTLNAGRAGAFESELARVLSDAVDRVGRIHSVGIAVLEPEDDPEDYVLLTVTFDGAWEAYVRVIWQKVSRLLDLIFCNTEGYVLGYENSYEKWGVWLKSRQTEAYFLYATPDVTVDDTRYLRMEERVYRRAIGADAERLVTRIKIPSPEEIAQRSIFQVDGLIGVDPTNAGFSKPLTLEAAGRPPFRHGVKTLVGLYRLADYYPPGTCDGRILHRAAQELLPEFVAMIKDGNSYAEGIGRARLRFDEAVLWLMTPPDVAEVRRDLPLMLPPEQPLADPGNVQGGILTAYPDTDHGGLLLLQFSTPAALAAFLNVLQVTSEANTGNPGPIATNVAFTVEGLRLAGLTDKEVRSLPDEFVQGMERRAGLLGDVRWNHPRRWRLPASNWALGIDAPDLREDDPAPRIDMSAVHAVLQLRRLSTASASQTISEARAPLMAEMKRLVDVDPGVRPLSIQWMQRQRSPSGAVQDHFGFTDGSSNPVLRKSEAGTRYSNQVHLGEILCAYPNVADKTGPFGDETNRAHALLRDGSFLALRKLRQDIEELEEVLYRSARQAADAAAAGATAPILTRETLLAKMMGRWPTGHPKAGQPLTPVAPPGPLFNDFNYDYDAQAQLCPFHAHIRRANPRVRLTRADGGARPPRIVRRGMSYGPPVKIDDAQAAKTGLQQERGLIFMAYNASLGEQFEVVQRWLAGGNSSGSYSGESDPFLGLAEPGRLRHFRFEHEGQTVRMALDGSDRLHDEPRPFVRLEWGAYFFAPSKKALASLQQWAAAQDRKPPVTWSADDGEKEIARLREIERQQGEAEAMAAWKTALEDPDSAANFINASIWAAIRERHGGVLRTPFGVLVADRDMVTQVFADPDRKLTITGYLPRMLRSFGILYLGRDAGQEDRAYEQESDACNAAIMALDQPDAFELARATTGAVLQYLVKKAKEFAQDDGEASWDLTVDVRELLEPLLGKFCEEWFGLSEQGGYFRRAGYRWDWKPGEPPNYPGHFLSPSRYIFQPHPNQEVEAVGAAHGTAVRSAMIGFLNQFGATNAPVTKAVFNSPRAAGDIPFVARTIAGAMMGFIPTVDGNLRRILNEWLREETLWSLRARYAGTAAKNYTDALNRLGDDFIPAMQLRAVPELIWRTAVVSHTLGTGKHEVAVKPGDIIVAGAISATQQNLVEGRRDVYQAFGGNRRVTGHPTHSCPGAHPALAVMLGFFSALVESTLPLRAGPGPLTLSLDGRLPGQPGSPLTLALETRMLTANDFRSFDLRSSPIAALHDPHEFQIRDADKLQRVATAQLVTLGDSWLFKFPFGLRPSLTSSLEKLGYVAADSQRFGTFGARLEEMAGPDSLDALRNCFQNPDPSVPAPQAMLMGGGGNDVVFGYTAPRSAPLYKMLRQAPPAGTDPLIEDEVHAFIDVKIANFYRTILNCVVRELKDHTNIPVLIHGYDHSIPDGRKDPAAGPWLKPIFEARGITDLTVSRDVIRRLIDRVGAMVATVAAEYPGRVFPVSTAGTLELDPRFQVDYKLLWANEFHPTEDGYDLLAKLVAKKLKDDLHIG